MATTPTQKQIPSEDVRDLKYNSGKIDQIVSSEQRTYTDRFGVERYTWQGALDSIAPLGHPWTMTEANAAIASGEIPNGAYFFVWSDNENIVADVYINNNGVAAPTGKSYPSAAFVEQMSNLYSSLSTGLSSEWVDNSVQQRKTTLLVDSSGRDIIFSNHQDKVLVAYGKKLADKEVVDGIGSETWSYNGSSVDEIIELVDAAGRIIRKTSISEKVMYLFGEAVGSGGCGPSYVTPSSWPELTDLPSYGQSLSISLHGEPGIETVMQNALMFNVGVPTYGKTPTSFVTFPNTTDVQYHEKSLIHQLNSDYPDDNRFYLAAARGVSGAAMSAIAPGTTPWTQYMNTITKAKQLADAQGRQYGMIAQQFYHAEADAYLGSSPEYYRSMMRLVQSTLSEKVKSVSGLPHDIPMIIYQMASHGRYQGLTNPSYEMPLCQLEEAISNPLIQLCTPMYIFPYFDGVHLTNHGYRWLDLYAAKAIKFWFDNKKPFKPLHPVNVSRVGSSTLVSDFEPPIGKIKFSEDIVTQASDAMNGFEIWSEDPSGTMTRLPVSETVIIGDKKLKVRSSSNFDSNSKIYLAYAFTPENRGASDGNGRYPSWNAGPVTGVRGNLCDSDETATDLLNSDGVPYPLNNYSVMFKKEAK
ncbi:Uncharacterised protein [Serratia quinivorans]|nr:Uncharacterised protein [Serratia quinivorans]